MEYDLIFIGPATYDVNIDYTGEEAQEIGGAVYFCTFAARAAQANVYAAVKIHSSDTDIIRAFSLPKNQIALLPSEKTTRMRNQYFTADRERRKASCLAQSDPITATELPAVSGRVYHLAGLLFGDFPLSLIDHLKTRGKVSADIQGFLRHNEGGNMVFHDWAAKLQYLRHLDFLKTDAAEAEILTGLSDRRQAAKQLHAWGAQEILISHNEEMLVYDGERFYACPVRARSLAGRTGRGDTVFGAYLARRVRGAAISEALLYATALVSLKMETPGPFHGTDADVHTYLAALYPEFPPCRS